MISKIALGENPQELSKKSIMAYIMPMSIWFLLWMIFMSFSIFLGLCMLVIGVLIVLHIQSWVLYLDEKGVWVYSGIFPWSQGVYGIKWTHFDEAVYFLNPISWSLKSYTLHIGNRYKDEATMNLTHVHNGDKSASLINETFMDFKN